MDNKKMNPLLLSQDRRPKSRHHIIIGHLYFHPRCAPSRIASIIIIVEKNRHAIFSSNNMVIPCNKPPFPLLFHQQF